MSSTQPSTIGRYEIIRRLGEGGMGAVYLARDPLIDRQIAVKFLREGLENDELRERFVREARSAGRLQHPNIVVIFDVGEQGGRPYIAMEYVEGSTIADLVRQREAVPLPQKLRLLEQLADGLAYAHRAGIVHRDIKPANLIISRDGVLKILDFGIARLGRAGLTMAGVMLGTLNYMSPEQITGAEVDRRSDIFAVGSVCYEFLSNTRAFPGDLQDGILHRILANHPPSLAGLCPGLDQRVIDIVNKALEKDPAHRYQDLEELRADLSVVRESLPSTGGGARPVVSVPVTEPRTQGTPSSAHRTMTGREQATKFRAEQIEQGLEAARQALARGAFDDVHKACQQVFVLDPDNATAVEISERARAAADEQVAEHVARANEALSRGAIEDASRIIKTALAVDPASAAAARTRQAIDEARRQREAEHERQRAIAAALSSAETSYSNASYETALRKLDEVLALDPGHARARTLRDEVQEAVEHQRAQHEAEALARGVVTQAWECYDRGDADAAVSLLERATPGHALISTALAEIRRLRDAARHAKPGTESERTMVLTVPTDGSDSAEPIDLDSTVVVAPLVRKPAGEPATGGAPKTATAARPGSREAIAGTPPPVPPPTAAKTAQTPPVPPPVPPTPAKTSVPPPAPKPQAAEPPPPPAPPAGKAAGVPGAKRAAGPVKPVAAPTTGGSKSKLVVVGAAVVVLAAAVIGGLVWRQQQPIQTVAQEVPAAAQATQEPTPSQASPPPAGESPATPPTDPAGQPAQAGQPATPGDAPPASTASSAGATAGAGTAAGTTPARRRRVEPTPVVTPAEPPPVAPAQPVAPTPRGLLIVDSDTPGATVFVNGQPVGTVPVRTALPPGQHDLRATLEGEEDITRSVDIGASGETSVYLRFKDVRLRTALQVIHKHGSGSNCEGRLSASTAGLAYESPNRNDVFSFSFNELERFQWDRPTTTLTVKRRGGRTWNFTSSNPDGLERFHQQVTRAREKLAQQVR